MSFSRDDANVLLAVWTLTVVALTILATGFAGDLSLAFSGNWFLWMLLASPAIPLSLWLWTRR